MAYKLNWEDHGVHVEYWGETTAKEIDEATALLRNSAMTKELSYVIADYANVDQFDIACSEALILAAHDFNVFRKNSTLKVALITIDEVFMEMCSRYASSPLLNGFLIQNFPTLAEGRAWVAE